MLDRLLQQRREKARARAQGRRQELEAALEPGERLALVVDAGLGMPIGRGIAPLSIGITESRMLLVLSDLPGFEHPAFRAGRAYFYDRRSIHAGRVRVGAGIWWPKMVKLSTPSGRLLIFGPQDMMAELREALP